jgi:multidrug transporter EmrE-like cation transporter
LVIGVWAIGLSCAGIFRTDPVSGYPPGAPAELQHPTPAGSLHDLVSLTAFFALALACFVFARSG